MKSRQILASAAALVLPVWSLCAQDSPPPRPPDAPQPDGAAHREGGPRPGGPGGPEGRSRPIAGFFGALDANHDGSIDAEEMNHAADALRKLDRNGDGKLTPDELRPQSGEERGRRPEGRGDARPPGENARSTPPDAGPRPDQPRSEGERRARPDGEGRPPRERDQPADGRRDPRPEQPRGDSERRPSPDAREQGRPEGPRQFDGRRPESAPLPPRPSGEERREGHDLPPSRDAGPQAWQSHRHHPHFFPGMPENGPRFANRDSQRNEFRPFPPPWIQRAPDGEQRPPDQFAMGQRFHEYRSWSTPDFRQEDRRDARGPAPWEDRRDFRLSPRGLYREQSEAPYRYSQPRNESFRDRQLGPGTRGFDRGDARPRPPEARPDNDRERSYERPVSPPERPDRLRFQRPPQQEPVRQGAEDTRPEAPTPV